MKSADLLLKSMRTAADCSGSAERTDSSWTQDDEIWTMLAQSTTNWNQLRTDEYQTWRETWSHCKCTSSISQGLFKQMKRNTDNIQCPTNKAIIFYQKYNFSYILIYFLSFSVTFNFIFLNFIHNVFLKCHRVNSNGPSLVKQTQNGLLADGEWTSDTHYNRSAIWVVFWPNGPHTASQLSNRYLPLLEDQVCEVGANLKNTHTFTATV